MVDTLTALGIKPDKIIGHSAGELGCAYADGAFTAEQTALAAYWRGKSILDAKLKIGAMAAVGKRTSKNSPKRFLLYGSLKCLM